MAHSNMIVGSFSVPFIRRMLWRLSESQFHPVISMSLKIAAKKCVSFSWGGNWFVIRFPSDKISREVMHQMASELPSFPTSLIVNKNKRAHTIMPHLANTDNDKEGAQVQRVYINGSFGSDICFHLDYPKESHAYVRVQQKPGGRILFGDPYSDVHKYIGEDVATTKEKAFANFSQYMIEGQTLLTRLTWKERPLPPDAGPDAKREVMKTFAAVNMEGDDLVMHLIQTNMKHAALGFSVDMPRALTSLRKQFSFSLAEVFHDGVELSENFDYFGEVLLHCKELHTHLSNNLPKALTGIGDADGVVYIMHGAKWKVGTSHGTPVGIVRGAKIYVTSDNNAFVPLYYVYSKQFNGYMIGTSEERLREVFEAAKDGENDCETFNSSRFTILGIKDMSISHILNSDSMKSYARILSQSDQDAPSPEPELKSDSLKLLSQRNAWVAPPEPTDEEMQRVDRALRVAMSTARHDILVTSETSEGTHHLKYVVKGCLKPPTPTS